MLTVLLFSVGSFIAGALVAWNNTKASLKAKVDSAISSASGDAKAALAQLKAKL